MRTLFAGRPIACEMGVLSVYCGLLHRTRILFASRPIACEMGVLEVFIFDLLYENQNLVY